MRWLGDDDISLRSRIKASPETLPTVDSEQVEEPEPGWATVSQCPDAPLDATGVEIAPEPVKKKGFWSFLTLAFRNKEEL